ncbi:hypothetical protein HPB49_008912 [Dermacentor silvarum]|uniref:Uncharacterized protein n=1 Tax=Dermacentor silvarum TaxID=543639 RepID=A0ACB8DY67_DERSI|nr:hypothetical protein HPB49_008912 [Dermacentor silvarum]
MELSEYVQSLPEIARQRYAEKLEVRGNQYPDPYTISVWKNDPKRWPNARFGDIYVYLLHTPGPYSAEAMRSYRSLKAYGLAMEGHSARWTSPATRGVTMMQVQVNGEDISPEEFLEGNGWCTIRYKTQSNRETAQSNTQNGAHFHTGEGANGNRQRSRQQQRNVKQQVLRNSKMPLLPRSDFKIVIRPRGGLDVATTGTVRLASAIYRAANMPAQEAGEDTVCSNNRQNIIVVSTLHATHAAKYRQLEAITIGDRRHEVSAYETAPDYTQRRMRSRTPRRTTTRDTETTEKVSWADAVTGKRVPTAKAGDKTPAKTETEIAKLTQVIQALQKQIEQMQTQIRAKHELRTTPACREKRY